MNFIKFKKLFKKLEPILDLKTRVGWVQIPVLVRTWGLVGSPSIVRVSDDRGGYHLLSMVTAQGELVHPVDERSINSEVYIEFLKKLLVNRERPLLLIVDNASYHTSNQVKKFVENHA